MRIVPKTHFAFHVNSADYRKIKKKGKGERVMFEQLVTLVFLTRKGVLTDNYQYKKRPFRFNFASTFVMERSIKFVTFSANLTLTEKLL